MDTLNLRQRILLNQPHIESVSGDITNFTTNMKAPLKECKVYFNPIQEGSGEPSLNNVRDIVGWNEVNIYNDPKYGGNIIWNQCYDLSTLKIGSGTSDVFSVTKIDTGFRVTVNADITGTGSKVIYFSIKWNRIQNHRYIYLCKIQGSTLKFSSAYFYHANGSSNRPVQNSVGQYAMIEIYTGSTATTNTSPRLYIYGCTLSEGDFFDVTDLMIIDLDMMFGTPIIDNLFNNTTTALERIDWFKSIITNYNYREYNEGEVTTVSAVNGDPCISTSISWANEVGTRYGGYIDLIKGELVIDWVYFLFSRSSKVSDYGTTADGLRKWMTLRITHNVPPYQITPGNGDDYGMFSIGNWRHLAETGKNRAYVNSSYVYAVITTDIEDLTTAEGRTAYFDRLEANNIPIEVVYKRATPLRYQLTPQQLLAFKGTNNIWSNTNGQTEVKFWIH